MPRYLVEADLVDASQLHRAEGLAALRFPEISVERRYSTHDGTGVRMIWVCRAPSEAHVDRWALALRLPVPSVRRIEIDRPPTGGRPGDSPSDGDALSHAPRTSRG